MEFKFKKEDVESLTLLSVEEARALPIELLALSQGQWWWLRSPGNRGSSAASVLGDGSVYEYGLDVGNDGGAVRPAFFLQSVNSNLVFGDKVKIEGIKATVISENIALADESIGKCAFRKDFEAADANDYEASDVKRWLENWWRDIDVPKLSYLKIKQEGEWSYESSYDAAEIANKACKALAFSDCYELNSLIIVLEEREVYYAGWEPGMRYILKDKKSGEIVWDCCYPEWDH